jgi:hypothetical protein
MTMTMICYPAAGKAIRRSAHSNLFGCAEVVILAISPLTRCPRCDAGVASGLVWSGATELGWYQIHGLGPHLQQLGPSGPAANLLRA